MSNVKRDEGSFAMRDQGSDESSFEGSFEIGIASSFRMRNPGSFDGSFDGSLRRSFAESFDVSVSFRAYGLPAATCREAPVTKRGLAARCQFPVCSLQRRTHPSRRLCTSLVCWFSSGPCGRTPFSSWRSWRFALFRLPSDECRMRARPLLSVAATVPVVCGSAASRKPQVPSTKPQTNPNPQ